MPKKVKHPWRKCPLGEHWVSEHSRNVPISERNPNGVTIVEGHCRRNSSRHEIFVADEIHDIATEYFKDLNNKPTPDALGFPKGNDYDNLIAGWTRFWNEVFQPEVPLDPNLIKALIASNQDLILALKLKAVLG